MTTRIQTADCHLYMVRDTVRGKFYVGKHRGREQQGYWGSGRRIRRHIKKYGRTDMRYEILVIGSEQYIYEIEKRLMTDDFVQSEPNCLNLCSGGIGGNLGRTPWNKGVAMPDEQKQKVSAAKMGKPSPRRGKKHTLEAIEKMRLSKLGKRPPRASMEPIWASNRGRVYPKVTCVHCGKVGGITSMNRWHFDNCRHKEQMSCHAL